MEASSKASRTAENDFPWTLSDDTVCAQRPWTADQIVISSLLTTWIFVRAESQLQCC